MATYFVDSANFESQWWKRFLSKIKKWIKPIKRSDFGAEDTTKKTALRICLFWYIIADHSTMKSQTL